MLDGSMPWTMRERMYYTMRVRILCILYIACTYTVYTIQCVYVYFVYTTCQNYMQINYFFYNSGSFQQKVVKFDTFYGNIATGTDPNPI